LFLFFRFFRRNAASIRLLTEGLLVRVQPEEPTHIALRARSWPSACLQ